MKTLRNSTVWTLSLLLTLLFLFSACSKDEDQSSPNPNPGSSSGPVESSGDPSDSEGPSGEVEWGTVEAKILFVDTDETLEFSGVAVGATGSQDGKDGVFMIFQGTDNPGTFAFNLIGVHEGENVLGEPGVGLSGLFQADSTETDFSKTYFLGADNYDEEDGVKDAASFHISTLTNDRIKGEFTTTMILNSTVKQGGEILSGEIKTMKVTMGKFDVPLMKAD